jgi:hypothetical protein
MASFWKSNWARSCCIFCKSARCCLSLSEKSGICCFFWGGLEMRGCLWTCISGSFYGLTGGSSWSGSSSTTRGSDLMIGRRSLRCGGGFFFSVDSDLKLILRGESYGDSSFSTLRYFYRLIIAFIYSTWSELTGLLQSIGEGSVTTVCRFYLVYCKKLIFFGDAIVGGAALARLSGIEFCLMGLIF